MNSQEIINYVMNTPGNTNPAILKQMVDGVGSGGGNVVIVTDTYDEATEMWTMNKTSTEIIEALMNQKAVFWVQDYNTTPLTSVGETQDHEKIAWFELNTIINDILVHSSYYVDASGNIHEAASINYKLTNRA